MGFVMPVRFRTSSETGGVVMKELLVSDDGGKTGGSRRDKLQAIKIRILPRKKQRPKVSQSSLKSDLSRPNDHPQSQQQGGRPTIAKRSRFSCWSSEESESQHLHHYDVVTHDVTSIAATTTLLPYSSCNDCDLHRDDPQLLSWNNVEDRDDDDDGRRRRSYRTAQNFISVGQRDASSPGYSDEVFEDVTETGADWRNSGRHLEALRPMNVGSASDQRRQRVSQPLPPRHRPSGPHSGASNAATAQGATERKPALIRRAVTDLEAAELAAGYPEVYYVGDTTTVNKEEPVRRRATDKKTQDSAGSVTRADDWKKKYDDEEGYYIHVPHDQIAYR